VDGAVWASGPRWWTGVVGSASDWRRLRAGVCGVRSPARGLTRLRREDGVERSEGLDGEASPKWGFAIGKGTGAVDLEGDLEGEEGSAFARAAAPFGDADASARVRDEGWMDWVASWGKSAKGTGAASELFCEKKGESGKAENGQTAYVEPRFEL
jgi:hypothetical protein